MSTVRRIVAGIDAKGAHTFLRVEDVEPVVRHTSWHGIIGWDQWPVLPIEGTQFVPMSSFPDKGVTHGVRIVVVDFPPGDIVDRERIAAVAAGGTSDRFGAYETSGMHSTDSVDVVFVISGSVRLTEGDGSSQQLGPGDCLVQNGSLHAWRNEASEPCRLGFVVFSAERES